MQDSWIPARQISFMGAICCEMNAAFGYCKVAEIVEIKGICFFVIFILKIKNLLQNHLNNIYIYLYLFKTDINLSFMCLFFLFGNTK